jgi:hypothetical protein
MSNLTKPRIALEKLMPLTRELYNSGIYKQPNYILPMVLASAQAVCMGVERISAIEFGVASGRGLLDLCKICEAVTNAVGIEFDVYGFDTYAGLPEIKDYRDHPEIWAAGQYATPDVEALRASLPHNCSLVVGNIKNTVDDFFGNKDLAAAPLGFVSIDLDFYSSTSYALDIFNKSSNCYLPSVMMYFDDIDGNITLNKWCGEELAIEEFNLSQAFRKIQRKLSNSPKMFCCHVLDHPVRTGAQKTLIPLAVPVIKYQR